jgi:hypothetical protein
MEGNSWIDNGNGTFTTNTGIDNWHYNAIDLYFMGLQGADLIAPFFNIDSPQVGNAQDIFGMPITNASPPQVFGNPVTIRGTRHNFTSNDLTSRLGPRNPAVGQAPTSWRAVFVLLASKTQPFDELSKQQFESMVDDYATGFAQGSNMLGRLDYQLMAQMPKVPLGGVCTMATDCNSLEANLCLTPSAGGQAFCTRGCTTPSSCPQGWCCHLDGTSQQNICTPADQCGPPDAGVVDSGTPPEMPDAGAAACACDTHVGCDMGCDCDPECFASADCACDMTTGCDPNCDCDPECAAGAMPPKKSGCGCNETASEGIDESLAVGILAWAVLALLVARPRRRPL